MIFTLTTDGVMAAADRIRTAAEAGYTTARNSPRLNTDAVRAGIARVFLTSKTKMDELRASATGDVDAQRRRLVAAAFGIDDLAHTGVDRASASVSYRDAQDRAFALDAAGDGAALLARAEDSGDELLARAVAQRAYLLGFMDAQWEAVLNDYLESRPAAAAAVAQLVALNSTNPNSAPVYTYWLARPLELGALQDFQLQALIDADDNAARSTPPAGNPWAPTGHTG